MTITYKAKMIFGKNLYLRNITVDDAEFVLDLRTDPIKSKHLSATSDRVEDQVNWIRSYAHHKDQAYFVVCDKRHNRLGCIRMYDFLGNSYCWGSWLMINGLGPLVAIESALLVYAYGKFLGFTEARIDVRQENVHVWKFHERFSGAQLMKEDRVERHYLVKDENISRMLAKYSDLLTTPLVVEPL